MKRSISTFNNPVIYAVDTCYVAVVIIVIGNLMANAYYASIRLLYGVRMPRLRA